MGLQNTLGIERVEPNVVQRSMQRLGGTRAGTAMFSRVLGPADRALLRFTNGRITAGGLLAALPVMLVTTTGARTGKQRITPLNAIPLGEELALIGTNFGSGATPGWAHNLVAHPEASVTYKDRVCEVTAHQLEGEEYERAWAAAIRIYPGYANYRRRAANEVPVFVLTTKELP